MHLSATKTKPVYDYDRIAARRRSRQRSTLYDWWTADFERKKNNKVEFRPSAVRRT
jgi:hypothetical protein